MDYFENNMYTFAEAHFKEELESNENDNLGARYYLAAIYANTSQWDQLNELYPRFEYSKNEVLFVFPLLVNAILRGENALATELFKNLINIKDHVDELLEDETFPIEDIREVSNMGEYQINSYEELCLACGYLIPLITSSNYVFDWMEMKYFNYGHNISANIQPSHVENISASDDQAQIIVPDFYKTIKI